MTKNSDRKRAIRAYMAEHGVPFLAAAAALDARKRAAGGARPAPARRVPVGALIRAIDGDRQLLDTQLTVSSDEERGGFTVQIPDVEGDIDIDSVVVDETSIVVDVHDELDGGTKVGAAYVDVEIEWSGCVFKADYYGAADDVPWELDEFDWNDHYVRVTGWIRARVTYSFAVDVDGTTGSVEGLVLEDFEAVDLLPAA